MDEHSRRIYEEYEDALFAVIMDQIAEEEGRQLAAEAKRLEEEGFQVPASLDEKCLKIIRDAEKQQRRKQRPKTIKRVAKVALIAATLMVLLFSVVYAASPEFRASINNWILSKSEYGTDIRVMNAEPAVARITFEFTYIPEGFSLYEHSSGSRVFYEDENYNSFYAGYKVMDSNTKITWDTEDAEVTYTKIHGYEGMIVKKIESVEGRQCVDYVWFNSDLSCLMNIGSYGLSVDEAEAIFDGCVISY